MEPRISKLEALNAAIEKRVKGANMQSHRINVETDNIRNPAFTYFCIKTKEQSAPTKDQNWKFHISVNISDLQNEFENDSSNGPLSIILETINKVYEGNYLEFKMTRFARYENSKLPTLSSHSGRLFYGTQFTFYIFDQGSEVATYEIANHLRKEISKALANYNIKPGLVPSSDLQLDDYSSLRYDVDEKGRYIAASDLKPGEFNKAKAPIPVALEKDVDDAQNNLALRIQFQNNKINAIEEAYAIFTEKSKTKRDQEEEKKIDTLAIFIRNIILSQTLYPEQTKQLIKVFTKKTEDDTLDLIQAAFEKVYQMREIPATEHDQKQEEQVQKTLKPEPKVRYSEQNILSIKNSILKARYNHQKQKIKSNLIQKFLKFAPLIIFGITIIPLLCYLSGLVEEKKEREKRIDIQPVILTENDKNNFLKNSKTIYENQMKSLYWPAEIPPELAADKNVSTAKILNKRNKFRLSAFFFKAKEKTKNMKLYVPEKDVFKIKERSKS